MGGKVEVDSRANGGALFTVHLPAVEMVTDSVEEPPAVSARNTASHGRGRVLLIENDAPSALFVRTVLERHGYEVIWAEGGNEGLHWFDRGGWDVVLLDMQMPGLDGYEVAQRIRRRPGGRYVPIVALTAHAMDGDREKCLDAGCSEYLAKPVDRGELVRLLARLTGNGTGLSLQPEASPSLQNLRREYLLRVDRELRALRDTVSAGNFERAARRAHSLKGSGGTYGFEWITRGAADLEQACQTGDADGALRAIDQLGGDLTGVGTESRPQDAEGNLEGSPGEGAASTSSCAAHGGSWQGEKNG
jgi:CheY-like chemotaxis protein